MRGKFVDDLSYPAVRRIRGVSLAHPHVVGHQGRDRAFHRGDLVPEIPVATDQVALSILDPRYHVRQKRVGMICFGTEQGIEQVNRTL